MVMIAGVGIQAINRPPVASPGEFDDYDVSCKVVLYLRGEFHQKLKLGERIVLKVATEQHDVTITGTVSNAALHEQIRAAMEDACQQVSGVRSVDTSAVNVDYGLT